MDNKIKELKQDILNMNQQISDLYNDIDVLNHKLVIGYRNFIKQIIETYDDWYLLYQPKFLCEKYITDKDSMREVAEYTKEMLLDKLNKCRYRFANNTLVVSLDYSSVTKIFSISFDKTIEEQIQEQIEKNQKYIQEKQKKEREREEYRKKIDLMEEEEKKLFFKLKEKYNL